MSRSISIDVCGDVNLAGPKWIANVRAAIGGSSQAAIGVARRPSDAFAQAVGDAVEALMTNGAHLPTPPHTHSPDCAGVDHSTLPGGSPGEPPSGDGD